MWILNTNTPTKQPLFRQIISLVEQAIKNGQLQAGDRLPSERELSQLLKVNRSTVVHALNNLTDRGILIRKMGSGSFINHQKWGLQSQPLINWQSPPSVLSKKNDSYTLKANQLRQEAQVSHKPLLDLSNGDLPAELLPALSLHKLSWQELLKHEQGEEASHLGLNSLRKVVKEYLAKSLKLSVDSEQILITSGTQQAIFLITQGLLKPGDAIGIESPSYFYSLPLFQATGLRIFAIPTDAEGITLEGLEKLINQKNIKMIFLNPVFQNPTGRLMSQTRKQQLLAYCYHKQIPIIEDDAYSALGFHKNLDTTPIKKLDKHQQVIYLGSLSKYLGKNIRAGWMVAPKSIINKLAEIRQQLDAGLSVLPQLLAEHYLINHATTHQKFLQQTLHARAKQLTNWLAENYSNQLQFNQPIGGYHLYAKCIQQKASDLNNLLESLLQQGIIVMRGSEFGDSPYCLRLSYGHFNMASCLKK